MKTNHKIIKNGRGYMLFDGKKHSGSAITKDFLLQKAWIDRGSNLNEYLFVMDNGDVVSEVRKKNANEEDADKR